MKSRRKSRGVIIGAFTLLCLLSSAAVAARGQASKKGELLASPSAFKLLASGVAYAGVKDSPYGGEDLARWKRDHKHAVAAGPTTFYMGHMVPGLDHEGLAAEDAATGAWTSYPMFRLAVAAGWYKPEGEKDDGVYPDAVNGLAKAGDKLWMGSNGVGVVVFDTRRRLWSRYDLSETPEEGRHTLLWHADEEYVFATAGEFPGARLHVYSARRERWLRLDAVPTANVRSYGHTGPMTQVTVNHAQFASKEHLPVDWSVALLDGVTPLEGGAGYLFERRFTEESRTVFTVTAGELEAAFDRLPNAD